MSERKKDTLIEELKQKEEFKKDNPDAMDMFDGVVEALFGKEDEE